MIAEMLYDQSIQASIRMKNLWIRWHDCGNVIWSINISFNKNEKPHGGVGKIVEMLYDQSI